MWTSGAISTVGWSQSLLWMEIVWWYLKVRQLCLMWTHPSSSCYWSRVISNLIAAIWCWIPLTFGIAGGSFYVGSEAAPFLNQATITLHGDRWFTIELPVIGSKMLAVTDLGGLGTCAHLYKRTNRLSRTGNHYVDPCPVKLVGRMELHGKPGISWTRLVETAPSGSSLLKLEEAVDWEVGVEVVITPTERGHQEEASKSSTFLDSKLMCRNSRHR